MKRSFCCVWERGGGGGAGAVRVGCVGWVCHGDNSALGLCARVGCVCVLWRPTWTWTWLADQRYFFLLFVRSWYCFYFCGFVSFFIMFLQSSASPPLFLFTSIPSLSLHNATQPGNCGWHSSIHPSNIKLHSYQISLIIRIVLFHQSHSNQLRPFLSGASFVP